MITMISGMMSNNVITASEIARRALQYKTKGEFIQRDNYCYKRAKQLGIFDQVCSHMQNKYNSWDYKKLKALTLQYDNLRDFYTQQHNAYEAIMYRGWGEMLLGHMKRDLSKSKTRKRYE